MKLLIDMNLSPAWMQCFSKHDIHAVHWQELGAVTASDGTIMEYARTHDCIVFTHDMDFGTLLALTQAVAPSVIQVRTQDVTPDHLESLVMAALRQFWHELEQGAILVIDEQRSRVRMLPLQHKT
jgi:predicted nuclease of predicted toxin-antitoxin system